MPGEIKVFHSETNFLYEIEKEFCKVYFENNQNYLTIEVESTEDLYHIEEDSIQNQFPKIILSLDNFEINFPTIQDLLNETILIDSEESLTYSKLSVESDDFKILKSKITFKQENDNLILNWKGKCEDFTQNSDEILTFEINCKISEQVDDDKYEDYEEFNVTKEKEKKGKAPNQQNNQTPKI